MQVLLKDKRVLELGSGAGFLGTLVGQLQLNTQSSGTLVMTDVNSKVLERCALNLKLDCNGLLAHSSLSLKPLNWFDALPEALTRPYVEQLLRDRAPDLVIGADLVYDPSVIPALCATLQLALSLPRSRVEQAEGLLALTVRREATIEEFMIQCAYHGLEVEGMALAPALETGFTSTMPKDLHGVDERNLKIEKPTILTTEKMSTNKFPAGCERKYVDIQDHGLIGNLHTAAMGGHFSVMPQNMEGYHSKQAYVPSSNILSTKFLGEKDFLPRRKTSSGAKALNHPLTNWLVRRVEIIRGTVPIRMECAPAFNYARDEHTMEIVDDETKSVANKPRKKVVFSSKDLTLDLRYVLDCATPEHSPEHTQAAHPVPQTEELCHVEFQEYDLRGKGHKGLGASVEITLEEGNAIWFILRDVPATPKENPDHKKLSQLTERALADGIDISVALRGAAALRPENDPVLTTMVCPRYTWIRDASFTLYALIRLGFTDEANAYMGFIFSRLAERNKDGSLNIMYSIHGKKDLEELELDHLDGHKGSKPVRIGNGAATHLQLDIYGELLDIRELLSNPLEAELDSQLALGVDVIKNVNRPDLSIWEVRSKEKNFVYSKVMMWVAIDRGLRLADKRSLPCPRRNEWSMARDNLYEEIMEKGWNKEKQFFGQSYEDLDIIDASLLVMPLVFFVAPTEPRFLSTLKQILKSPEHGGLMANNLVFRYDTEKSQDGVGGEEGAFSLTTLWAVEALGRAGHYDPAMLRRAVAIFEDFLGFGNHCGLFSEEISAAGEGLGNAVQGFTHVTLISAAFNLSRNMGQS
ncbi:hypothetical protein FRB96_002189 [Tulasnella sp. 330]|nr:hypothetical protein FRB96_002189 [Tulasnella sp. 330]